MALDLSCVVNIPLAVQALVVVGLVGIVAQSPGGSRVPTKTVFPLSEMMTFVAENVAMHPASQKVPMERRAWPASPGKMWAYNKVRKREHSCVCAIYVLSVGQGYLDGRGRCLFVDTCCV